MLLLRIHDVAEAIAHAQSAAEGSDLYAIEVILTCGAAPQAILLFLIISMAHALPATQGLPVWQRVSPIREAASSC